MSGTAPLPASTAGLEAEIVLEAAGLEALREDWRSLATACGNGFVTPEWYLAWLRHYGDEAAPRVVVVRETGGTLVGLLPLAVAPAGRKRALQFGGGTLGDHFHPVGPEADRSRVAAAAGRALAERAADFELAVLHNVEAGAPWVGDLAGAWPKGLSTTWDSPQPLPYIPLQGLDWEAFLSGLSSGLRKALGYELRRLERSHDVAFRATLSAAELGEDMARFFRLHDLRWSGRGGSSLASERARSFLADFAGDALSAAWLRLWFLEVDGEPIAAWLGWQVGTRYAFFQSGFDPAWSRHSPGLLLVAHTIRDAIEQGASEYDMLLGDESYKARFAAEQRAVSTAALAPALGLSRVVAALDIGLRRLGRKLPPEARRRVRELADPVLRRLPTARNR
jgi:CelD/BcsL family acetyltransferase involved in cellulose biosynthesis